MVKEILLDSLIDALKTLPFLFAVYLLIEYMEHKASDKLGAALKKCGKFGAVGGAAIGCIPQCGFSVAAANLYSGRIITMGTIIAVFISTSDEAVPMLLSNPDKVGMLWKLIVIKVIIAVIAGVLVDLTIRAFRKRSKTEERKPFEELCTHCGCKDHSILFSALKHTSLIFALLLVVNIALGFGIELIGEDRLRSVLMTDSVFQPFIAAIIGFIPNCAASVLLTDLYIEGILSFASLIAGLCTGAGMGLIVLLTTNKHIKENLTIIGILYGVSVISGLVISLF